jgi:hypothetical protein
MSAHVDQLELAPLSALALLTGWRVSTAPIRARSARTVAAGRWVFTGFLPTAVTTRRVAGPHQAHVAPIAPMGVRTTWPA